MRCIRAVKALRALARAPTLHVVALYTDVDRDAPFVRHADAARRARRRRAARSRAYLDHDGCSRRCARAAPTRCGRAGASSPRTRSSSTPRRGAGIRFLGPSGEAMRALGDKIAAKQLAERAGVPVTPWSGGAVATTPRRARSAPSASAIPLVVKATAGRRRPRHPRRRATPRRSPPRFASAARRGARRVRRRPPLPRAQMVRGGRHIEVQIAADQHGVRASRSAAAIARCSAATRR